MKTSLSYSTMNALIAEPHTWLCKQMGLKTFQTQAMAEGNAAHEIIQRHISGTELHPILTAKGLPTFSKVEREKWDEQMRVRFEIDDNYYFTGFIDGDEPSRGDFLEIKTGKVWSPGEFARLIQWKLYALGRPGYTKIWMINTPKVPAFWMDETIKIFNQDITEEHKQEARDFIQKAINVIATIKEQRLEPIGQSRFCYYINCPWCKREQQ